MTIQETKPIGLLIGIIVALSLSFLIGYLLFGIPGIGLIGLGIFFGLIISDMVYYR